MYWEVLGATWGLLGRPWTHFRRLGEVSGASWMELGASWKVLESLGDVLGPSCDVLGVSREGFGRSWRFPETILEAFLENFHAF